MFQQPWYVTILPALPILLAHLAGIVVAVILLVRHGGTPAILALIGFGVLFVADLAGFAGGPLVGLLASQTRQFLIANVGVGCCCSVLDVVAIVCLIVAIWQAVSGAAAGETVEEVVGVLVEAPEEIARATRVLEETLEGTVETSEEAVEEGAGTPE